MNQSSSAWAGSVVHGVKHCRIRHLMVLRVLLAGLPFYAFGREATIVGTVTDPSGSVVPNMAMTIINV